MIKVLYRIGFIQLIASYALSSGLLAQTVSPISPLAVDYTAPARYVLEDVRVTGNTSIDEQAIINLLGFRRGEMVSIPGPVITDTISRLWKQGLVKDVAIYAARTTDRRVLLTIDITECPRLSGYSFEGIKRKEQKKLRKKLTLAKGKIVTDALIGETKKAIQDYYVEAGYRHPSVSIVSTHDPTCNDCVQLQIKVDRGSKLAIGSVYFEGNERIESDLLKSQMRYTREKPRFTLVKDLFKKVLTLQPIRRQGVLWRPVDPKACWRYLQRHVILMPSQFKQAKFEEDKKRIVRYYQSKGFSDATIVEEALTQQEDASLNVWMKIEEGRPYRVGNIKWVGNYRYDDSTLQQTMGVKKGDLYDPLLLQQQLYSNPEGRDIVSLYMDEGYLFFQADSVEVGLEEDTIDLEIRVQEGATMRINEVLIEGNKLTHDAVIRRELRTLPGDQFNRTKLQRSYRELAQLNLFAPTLEGRPIPNLTDKTVDIKYKVQERFKFSVNLSGGWGEELIGELSLFTNNFSFSDLWKARVPIGGGQTLGFNAETNGRGYRNFSLRFADPWLGGKKPTLFHASLSRSSEGSRRSIGGDVGLGTKLTWPDEYMVLRGKLAYYRHDYQDHDLLGNNKKRTGVLNDLATTLSLERDSTAPNPIYPKEGSKIALHANLTPPWFLVSSKPYSSLSDWENHGWKEYNQWMLDGSYFFPLLDDLVLNMRAHFGVLGNFSSKRDIGPFERFTLGGGTRPGHRTLRGEKCVSLRGYEAGYITPEDPVTHYKGGVVYDKFVLELRYPLISNYVATAYALVFAEGGNTWAQYNEYNLFDLKRSAGVGLRVYIPFILGATIGFDFGYGFDKRPTDKKYRDWEFHFSIGAEF